MRSNHTSQEPTNKENLATGVNPPQQQGVSGVTSCSHIAPPIITCKTASPPSDKVLTIRHVATTALQSIRFLRTLRGMRTANVHP